MKKINVILGILTGIVFLCHSIIMSLLLQKVLPFSDIYKRTGEVLVTFLIAHLIFSSILVIRDSGLYSLKPVYFRQNLSTYIQRYSGIVVIILVLLHMRGYGHFDVTSGAYIFRKVNLKWFCCEAAMVVIVGLHLWIGMKKATVIFGLKKEKNQAKKIDLFFGAMIGICVIFSMIGFVKYFF